MTFSRSCLIALAACFGWAPCLAFADEPAPAGATDESSPAVASMTMGQAWDALTEDERTLAAGDCATMCKALHSMVHAAQRICTLAEGGGDADRQRCLEARRRVEEATKRVLAACPACNPSPPFAPAMPPVVLDGGSASAKKDSSADSFTLATPVAAVEAQRASPRARQFTIALLPATLLFPPVIVRLAGEVRVIDHLSFGLSGGLGRITTVGSRRATATTFGAQVRAYFLAPFSGPYLGAELRYAHASLHEGDQLSTRAFVPGLTIGPMLGIKAITLGGFTIDVGVGLGIVAVDRRSDAQPDAKVVPTWDLSVGYSF